MKSVYMMLKGGVCEICSQLITKKGKTRDLGGRLKK